MHFIPRFYPFTHLVPARPTSTLTPPFSEAKENSFPTLLAPFSAIFPHVGFLTNFRSKLFLVDLICCACMHACMRGCWRQRASGFFLNIYTKYTKIRSFFFLASSFFTSLPFFALIALFFCFVNGFGWFKYIVSAIATLLEHQALPLPLPQQQTR